MTNTPSHSQPVPLHLAALPYRNGVGAIIFNRENQVFVAKRIDTTAEAWQMPQGGMDSGEAPLQALLRELQEEIGAGAEMFEMLRESSDWYTYDLPDALIGQIWGGQYRGQRQKWFALRFLGQDSDINIATSHPEFLEWKWVDMRLLPDLIVPFKRNLYKALVAEFAHLA